MDYNLPANDYRQPIKEFVKLYITNMIEKVDFAQNNHVRIWYNHEVEGYPLHKHSVLEIAIPVESTYSYTIEGKRIVLNEGDILFIPPNLLHEIESSNEGKRFIFLFDIDFIRSFYDFPQLSQFMSGPTLMNDSIGSDNYRKILHILMNIADVYFSRPQHINEMLIFSNLLQILSIIADETSQNDDPYFTSNKQREIFYSIKDLVKYLELHYMDNISLDEAAAKIGFSKFHFARLFKEYMHMSFYEFLTSIRVEKAKTLLEDQNLRISTIANSCGFSSNSTFTRCFENYTKLTPSKYRQLLLSRK